MFSSQQVLTYGNSDNKENVLTLPAISETLMKNWRLGCQQESQNVSHNQAEDVLCTLFGTEFKPVLPVTPATPPTPATPISPAKPTVDQDVTYVVSVFNSTKQKSLSAVARGLLNNDLNTCASLLEVEINDVLLQRRFRLLALFQILMNCKIRGICVWQYLPIATKRELINMFFHNELHIEIRSYIEDGSFYGKFFERILQDEDLLNNTDRIYALLTAHSDDYSTLVTIMTVLIVSFQAAHDMIHDVIEDSQTSSDTSAQIDQTNVVQWFSYLANSSVRPETQSIFITEMLRLVGGKLMETMQNESTRIFDLLRDGSLEADSIHIALKGLFIISDNMLFYKVDSSFVLDSYRELAEAKPVVGSEEMNVRIHNDWKFLQRKYSTI